MAEGTGYRARQTVTRVVYFIGAIITHLRAHWYSIGYPAAYRLLAASSLVLGVAS